MKKRTRDFNIKKIVKRDYVLYVLTKGDWKLLAFYTGRETRLMNYIYLRSLVELANETAAYDKQYSLPIPDPYDDGYFR